MIVIAVTNEIPLDYFLAWFRFIMNVLFTRIGSAVNRFSRTFQLDEITYYYERRVPY
jgi:hypothetical protein